MPLPVFPILIGVGLAALALAKGDEKKEGGGGAGGGGGGGGGGAGGKTGDVGGGSTALLTCDEAFKQLGAAAPALALLVSNARNTASETQLLGVAKAVEDGANATKDVHVRSMLGVVVQCLRAEAHLHGGGDPEKVPPLVTPKKGIASTKMDQTWIYTVVPGDSPSRITARVRGGVSSTPAIWSELITENPRTEIKGDDDKLPATGRNLGIKGTPGTMSYQWSSLLAGDRLRIPRAWNRWVDQTGVLAGSPIPFPEDK